MGRWRSLDNNFFWVATLFFIGFGSFYALVRALPVHASFSVSVVGTTATQAVLSYDAPDDNPCSVQVSENSGLSPLVNDVNPTLFPGSNLDDRPGSITNGTNRIFVVGQRTSDEATDGKLYSRALQAYTTHYFEVTCDSESVTGSFQTMDPPIGDTYPETPPFNTAGFGNYAWPTMDWGSQTSTYIDPLTGIEIERLTTGLDTSGVVSNQLFNTNGYNDLDSAWTNPGNATAGTTGSLAVTSQNNAPLFLATDPLDIEYGSFDYGDMLDLGVDVLGDGSSATSSDRQVSLCLSLDSGQTCYTNSITVTLPQTAPTDNGIYPTDFPTEGFQGWGKTVPVGIVYPRNEDNAPMTGVLDVSSGNVTVVSGATFAPSWASGSKIWIASSSPTCAHNLCTISSVTNSTHISLVENLTMSNANWISANFGVRVTKVSGGGNVSVSLKYNMGWATQADPGTDSYKCSDVPTVTTVNAAGNPLGYSLTGYLCTISNDAGDQLYWVGDNGDVRYISAFTIPVPMPGVASSDAPQPGRAGGIWFDLSNGNTMYTELTVGTDSLPSLFKLTYTGNYAALNQQWDMNPGFDVPYQNDDITWSNLTPPSLGMDINSQIETAYPAYNETNWGQVSQFDGVTQNYAMFQRTADGVQNNACWAFIFNLSNGQIVQGFNSYDGNFNSNLRWAGCHSLGDYDDANAFYASTHNLAIDSAGVDFGGPYFTTVTAVQREGVFVTSTTALPPTPDGSYDATCPSGLSSIYTSTGATGSNCVTLKVAGQPCSISPGSVELATSPCPTNPSEGFLQNMEVGDYINDPGAGIDSEVMRIVSSTINSSTSITLILQRLFNEPEPGGTGTEYYCQTGSNAQDTHSNGWQMDMVPPPNNATCYGGGYTFNVGSSSYFYVDGYWARGHATVGVGSSPGQVRLVAPGVSSVSGDISVVQDNLDYAQNQFPGFAGDDGMSYGSNALQSYGNNDQFDAPSDETQWALDQRHIAQAGNYTSVLQSGTASVYEINYTGNTIDYKDLPLLVWAGQNLLKDVSSPVQGNTLTDADTWDFCFALNAGECRSGSAAGNLYVVVPQAETMNNTQCPESNQYTTYAGPDTVQNTPCAIADISVAANVTQTDITQSDATGANTRTLSMGFSGPGRQYAYATAFPTPEGNMAIFSGYSLDGLRTDALLAFLPPFPAPDDIDRTTFIPTQLNLTPPTGQNITNAIVKFGYAENGTSTDYYCTGRQETCVAAQTSDYTDYYFQNTDSYSGVPCTTSCEITLPTIPQRITYYEVDYRNASDTVVSSEQGATSELAVTSVGGSVGVPPTIPTGLAANPISTSEIDLSWTASTDNAGVAGYDVYRNGTNIATTSATTYDDTGLTADTSYSYAVDALDATGDVSARSSSTNATTEAQPSGGGGGSGSGGGGGYYTPISPASTSPISNPVSTVSSLQAELNALLAELASLESQTGETSSSTFTRNLTIGSTGADVKALQQFLNDHGFIISESGPGSPGQETTYFGAKTQLALAAYQKSVGITPDTGYFGLVTRAALGGGTITTGAKTPIQTATPATPSTPSTPSTPITPSLSFGSTGATVFSLQKILVNDGYLSPGVFVQGTFDAATERAVEIFQCFEGIACSAATPGYGIVGPKTRAAIFD